jgi:hypothetical protein
VAGGYMNIGVMEIKAWDRDNVEIEKFDINLADQDEIKAIMNALADTVFKQEA